VNIEFCELTSEETASLAAPRRLHVGVIDEELPFPTNSGKRIRTLNLLQRLAARHRITFFCHQSVDPSETQAAVAHLNSLGIETIIVDRQVPTKSGAAFYGRLFANLFSPRPYSVATHDSLPLRQAVAQYARTHEVDLWQCEWTPYAEAMRELPGTPYLVMAHNIETQIWERYHASEPNRLKRWYIGHQMRKFAHYERRVLAQALTTMTVSDEDARLARHRFAARHVEVVDNGVDTEFFRPGEIKRDPRKILFLGSLDWRPNLDAVRVLLDEIFPQVLQAEPTARLQLVGRKPPPWLTRVVENARGVEMFADVPDVRPFLHGCGVLAVPLRIGGGSRLKILEALATATPVVSTRVGAEGLALEADRHFVQVERVEEMAPALVAAVKEPASIQPLADLGRQVVLDRYDWNALAAKLEQVWLAAASPARSSLSGPHRPRTTRPTTISRAA